MQIVIDPGHGGHDARGHSTPYGDRTGALWEKDLNLRLAERVAAHLGGSTVLTRAEDQNLSLQERAALARRLGARAFISLHGHSGRSGTEVYVHARAGTPSRALADSVQRELAFGHGCACPPVPRELAVLHPEALGAAMPACMVECGYDGELAKGHGPSLDRLGASIARGVRTFLGAATHAHGDRAPLLAAHGLDMDLGAAIDACTPVINGSGFPTNQVNRLTCLMQKIRTTSVDDRYINGFDWILTTLGPRLTDDQLTQYLDSNHVRKDVIDAAQSSDIKTNMDLLDQRFMRGISWLNQQMYTQGGALPEAVLQIKDWVVARQQDQNSVYWCYGAGQDSYGAAYGNRTRRRDSRSACG
jgi:hypothetical protein